MGDFAAFFEVSSALTKEALMDHAAVSGVMTWLAAPLAHFFTSPKAGYCRVH
jgi:hypothetical protein